MPEVDWTACPLSPPVSRDPVRGKSRASASSARNDRAMYRRRRAVALVIVLAAVSLVVFCVYSLGRGVVDGMSLLRPTPIARESVPGAEEDQRRQ